MIYLSIHGCCMRKITLGSRGPGNSLHCQWPWQKRVINLNLWMELRDLNLSLFMKSFIFSDVSTQFYLLRKHLILTYLLLFYDQLPDCRFSVSKEEKRRQIDLFIQQRIWIFSQAVSTHPLSSPMAMNRPFYFPA